MTEPKFFDGQTPFLPQIAEELIARHTKGRTLDLAEAAVVFPVQHAQRRFEAVLLQAVNARIASGLLDPDWTVPETMLVGSFIDRFYAPSPAADSLAVRAAWRKGIDETEKEKPDEFRSLFLGTGTESDFSSRCDRADRISALYREIAACGHTFGSIAAHPALTGDEKARWSILAQIEAKYRAVLDSLHRADTEFQRQEAVRQKRCRPIQFDPSSGRTGEKTVYLAGIIELSAVQKQILTLSASVVVPFVYAPENIRSRFDSFGTLKPDAGQEWTFEIGRNNIYPAATPVGEGVAAARMVRETIDSGAVHSDEPCLIGVLDEEVRPFLEQELEGILTPARDRELKENRVILLLGKIARFLSRRQFDAFAELVRISDFEHFLIAQAPELESLDWLSALDRYQNQWIPDTISIQGDRGDAIDERSEKAPLHRTESEDKRALFLLRQTISAVFTPFFQSISGNNPSQNSAYAPGKGPVRLRDILENMDGLAVKRRLLPQEWIEPLNQLITALYPPENESPVKTAPVNAGIQALHSFFDQVETFPDILAEPVSIDEFLDIFRRQVLAQPDKRPQSGKKAEVIGWLNTIFDDRSTLILAGFNDDKIPSRGKSLLFLTDSLRKRLNIPGSEQRQQADAYYLQTILANRPNTRFLFARQSLDQSPKRPSRFLMMTSDLVENAERVRDFLKSDWVRNPNIPPGKKVLFSNKPIEAPILRTGTPVPKTFRASSMQTFLENPYLWFLQNAFHAETLNDRAEELGAKYFGTLIHSVLEQFARSDEVKDSADELRIASFLDDALDRVSGRYINASTSGTVLIQREMARQRLRRFAQWQAAWRRGGNHILCAEEKVEYEIEPQFGTYPNWYRPDEPVFVSGTIDRIDFNERTGEYYVFDYKTYDDPKLGNKRSNDGDGEPLLNCRRGNEMEHRYWKRVAPPIENDKGLTFTAENDERLWRWIDLQLPLYHELARRRLLELEAAEPDRIRTALVILPKSHSVCAYRLNREEGLDSAEAAFFWSVHTIRRIWREGVDPNALIDPEIPELGTILPEKAKYMEKYAGLTLR